MRVDCTVVRTDTGPKFRSECWFSSRVRIAVVMDIDVVSSDKEAIYSPSSNGITDGGTVWMCN